MRACVACPCVSLRVFFASVRLVADDAAQAGHAEVDQQQEADGAQVPARRHEAVGDLPWRSVGTLALAGLLFVDGRTHGQISSSRPFFTGTLSACDSFGRAWHGRSRTRQRAIGRSARHAVSIAIDRGLLIGVWRY